MLSVLSSSSSAWGIVMSSLYFSFKLIKPDSVPLPMATAFQRLYTPPGSVT
eukprot:CAMPEP_0116915684 /NCGR_PEP_ID=MMETSP0467-20121206/18074_1 /TAXON_ID=283647 /ORGANISM="Mesodinium pulex, Strain SPMC105" /LENGTH=50 /DNA_ID=CAMNT_0004592393 /DNA_START=238 /DNA_END=390 /DNA_ORIENTATION=-